jgi:type IV secretion system protein VirB1
MDFLMLAQQCAPDVHPDTMRRIVHVESSFNPYAIGVVGGRLAHQPRQRDEAMATAQWLQKNGYNFSVGLAQVNQSNFAR